MNDQKRKDMRLEMTRFCFPYSVVLPRKRAIQALKSYPGRDSSYDAWCLSALQAVQGQFDEKLCGLLDTFSVPACWRGGSLVVKCS